MSATKYISIIVLAIVAIYVIVNTVILEFYIKTIRQGVGYAITNEIYNDKYIVDIKRHERTTCPLQYAIRKKKNGMVKYMLEKNVTIDLADTRGYTALHIAVLCQNFQIIQLLLEKKAKINVIDRLGRTPLYCACQVGDYNIVKILVSHKANVNIGNNYLNTPLHVAARDGHLTIVKLLISSGADIKKKNKFGADVIAAARDGGNIDIINYLEMMVKNRGNGRQLLLRH